MPARKPPGKAQSAPAVSVVYPKNGHKTYEGSTFLVGSVPQGAGVRVNGKAVPASTHGFFAWKVPLKDGANKVLVEAVSGSGSTVLGSRTLMLTRVPPLPVLPAQPLAVHPQTIRPSEKTILKPGDYLAVACSASVDSQVSVLIPGVLDEPMALSPMEAQEAGPYLDNRTEVFLEPHQTEVRIPVKGYYRGMIPIPLKAKAIENAPIQLVLKNGSASLTQVLPATLSVWTEPKLAVVTKDRAVTRSGPGTESPRLTPQRLGTRVWVDGLLEGWARVRLDRNEIFYIGLEDLAFQLPAKPAGNALEAIRTQAGRDAFHAEILLQTRSQVPLTCQVTPSDGEDLLHIRLYNSYSQCDFVHCPVESRYLKRVTWKQLSDDIVEVTAAVENLAGYEYVWTSEGWKIIVKTLPDSIGEVRVLVDPGHGGAETGTTGPNGLREKSLNLTVSKLLADALAKEGFQVRMTRTSDVPVALEARSGQAAREDADLILSIHHNALPDGRDPLQYQGACSFYYHPFAEPLAQAVQVALVAQGSRNQGVFFNNLHLTRIHQGMAVLVELGYFTHPEDFERLIQPKIQQSQALAMAKAVKDFVLARRRKE